MNTPATQAMRFAFHAKEPRCYAIEDAVRIDDEFAE
jgi:hypothetical protein